MCSIRVSVGVRGGVRVRFSILLQVADCSFFYVLMILKAGGHLENLPLYSICMQPRPGPKGGDLNSHNVLHGERPAGHLHRSVQITETKLEFCRTFGQDLHMVVKIESRSFSTASFIIVYTCKPHINHKYSLIIITPRILSSENVVFRLMRKIVTQSLRPFHMEARLKKLSLGVGGGGGSVLQKEPYYILNVERWLFVTKIWRSGVCGNIARDTGVRGILSQKNSHVF